MVRPRKDSDLNLSRALILERALAFTKEHGLGALTMKKTAQSFGVSEPAIYHHFRSRSALVEAIVDALAHKLLRRIESASGSWRERAWRFLEALLALLIEYPETSNYFLKHGVSTTGGHLVADRMVKIMDGAGLSDEAAAMAAYHATLYVHAFGKWHELRYRRDARAARRGAPPPDGADAGVGDVRNVDEDASCERAFYRVMSRKSPHERFYSGLRLIFDGLDAAVSAVKDGRTCSLEEATPRRASYDALSKLSERPAKNGSGA